MSAVNLLEDSRTTINNHIRPVNIGPRPTRKQHTNPIQFPHSTHPPHRISLRPTLPRLCNVTLSSIQNRIHIPRRNRIDSNAMYSPLGRETSFHSHNRRFTHIICDLRLRVIHTMGGNTRCQSYRPAGFLLDELFRHGLCAEECTSGVDVESFAPLDVCHFDGVDATYYSGEAEEVVD